jgi:hypothetical protein
MMFPTRPLAIFIVELVVFIIHVMVLRQNVCQNRDLFLKCLFLSLSLNPLPLFFHQLQLEMLQQACIFIQLLIKPIYFSVLFAIV